MSQHKWLDKDVYIPKDFYRITSFIRKEYLLLNMSTNGMNYPMYKYDLIECWYFYFILFSNFSAVSYPQMAQQQQQQPFYGQRFTNSIPQVEL